MEGGDIVQNCTSLSQGSLWWRILLQVVCWELGWLMAWVFRWVHPKILSQVNSASWISFSVLFQGIQWEVKLTAGAVMNCSLIGKPTPLSLRIISLLLLIQDSNWHKSCTDVNRKTIKFFEHCSANVDNISCAIAVKWKQQINKKSFLETWAKWTPA